MMLNCQTQRTVNLYLLIIEMSKEKNAFQIVRNTGKSEKKSDEI